MLEIKEAITGIRQAQSADALAATAVTEAEGRVATVKAAAEKRVADARAALALAEREGAAAVAAAEKDRATAATKKEATARGVDEAKAAAVSKMTPYALYAETAAIVWMSKKDGKLHEIQVVQLDAEVAQ